MNFLIFLIVGGVSGCLAGKFVKGEGFGLVGNIIVGVIGAMVAGIVLPILGITIGGGFLGDVLHSTIGAVILLGLIRLIKKS